VLEVSKGVSDQKCFQTAEEKPGRKVRARCGGSQNEGVSSVTSKHNKMGKKCNRGGERKGSNNLLLRQTIEILTGSRRLRKGSSKGGERRGRKPNHGHTRLGPSRYGK